MSLEKIIPQQAILYWSHGAPKIRVLALSENLYSLIFGDWYKAENHQYYDTFKRDEPIGETLMNAEQVNKFVGELELAIKNIDKIEGLHQLKLDFLKNEPKYEVAIEVAINKENKGEIRIVYLMETLSQKHKDTREENQYIYEPGRQTGAYSPISLPALERFVEDLRGLIADQHSIQVQKKVTLAGNEKEPLLNLIKFNGSKYAIIFKDIAEIKDGDALILITPWQIDDFANEIRRAIHHPGETSELNIYFLEDENGFRFSLFKNSPTDQATLICRPANKGELEISTDFEKLQKFADEAQSLSRNPELTGSHPYKESALIKDDEAIIRCIGLSENRYRIIFGNWYKTQDNPHYQKFKEDEPIGDTLMNANQLQHFISVLEEAIENPESGLDLPLKFLENDSRYKVSVKKSPDKSEISFLYSMAAWAQKYKDPRPESQPSYKPAGRLSKESKIEIGLMTGFIKDLKSLLKSLTPFKMKVSPLKGITFLPSSLPPSNSSPSNPPTYTSPMPRP